MSSESSVPRSIPCESDVPLDDPRINRATPASPTQPVELKRVLFRGSSRTPAVIDDKDVLTRELNLVCSPRRRRLVASDPPLPEESPDRPPPPPLDPRCAAPAQRSVSSDKTSGSAATTPHDVMPAVSVAAAEQRLERSSTPVTPNCDQFINAMEPASLNTVGMEPTGLNNMAMGVMHPQLLPYQFPPTLNPAAFFQQQAMAAAGAGFHPNANPFNIAQQVMQSNLSAMLRFPGSSMPGQHSSYYPFVNPFLQPQQQPAPATHPAAQRTTTSAASSSHVSAPSAKRTKENETRSMEGKPRSMTSPASESDMRIGSPSPKPGQEVTAADPSLLSILPNKKDEQDVLKQQSRAEESSKPGGKSKKRRKRKLNDIDALFGGKAGASDSEPEAYRLGERKRVKPGANDEEVEVKVEPPIEDKSEGEITETEDSQNEEVDSAEQEAAPPMTDEDMELDPFPEEETMESEGEEADVMHLAQAPYWTQTAAARLYYARNPENPAEVVRTERHKQLEREFDRILIESRNAKRKDKKYAPPTAAELMRRAGGCCGCGKQNAEHESESNSDTESSCSDDSNGEMSRAQLAQTETQRKETHPDRMHRDLWFNEVGQLNDGPLCRCSWRSRSSGIRHNVYAGEEVIPKCNPQTNNSQRLCHYRVIVTPTTNLKIEKPCTRITHDKHDYYFEGFSILCHQAIPDKLPPCRVIRYNLEYTVSYLEEEIPENFCIGDLDQFYQYVFHDLLELYDLSVLPFKSTAEQSCPVFHLLPRFSRDVYEGGKELLPMCFVLDYLHESYRAIFPPHAGSVLALSESKWDSISQKLRGQIAHNPYGKPTSLRVDQIDRPHRSGSSDGRSSAELFPLLIHFGVKPAMLTYAGNPEYQKAHKQFIKFRHLLANKPKVTADDRQKLAAKEAYLHRLRSSANLKREVTVEVSSEGFKRTGIYSDVVQNALMLPVLFQHLRFHWSLKVLENSRLQYTFKNRALIQLALTHPSYRTHYGLNPDHARNTLSNSGIRQPVYGDARTFNIHTRKRGINTLIDIMSRMGSRRTRKSRILNNERLEYLGDAVIEFLSSIHLYFLFPQEQEGGLASFRSALVQNRHLAMLAKRLGLDEFMLYAHGPDLCHDSDLRHAMANCFEAVMAAIYLDGGLDAADAIFARALFPSNAGLEDDQLHYIWTHLPPHPLQAAEPEGDRHWVEKFKPLQKLTKLEDDTGIYFKHVRILGRAFTRRNVGMNYMSLGHNQRLEFLGDTVLQLITSTYLYRHFPDHHEGHLSLLRSCLVNNRTQSVICDDLGLTEYVIRPATSKRGMAEELRMKDRADLVEALIGAIYVDRGLKFCEIFCKVCFFPRLKYFIITQKWNDAKSQLQQCCLTLRSPNGGEPDIPQYRIIKTVGPTNTRLYTVAVYFKGRRLATGDGHSVQLAEMESAKAALRKCQNLFPHLERQREIIERRFKQPGSRLYGDSGRPRNVLSSPGRAGPFNRSRIAANKLLARSRARKTVVAAKRMRS